MSLQLTDQSLLRGQAYIDGVWIDADSGDTLPVNDPATCNTIAEVARCGTDETRRAIAAAKAAQIDWRQETAKARANLLRRWFNLVMEHQEDLAQILTAEQGKPLDEARGEVVYAASFIEWFAEEGKRIYGDIIPTHAEGSRIIVTKEPVGVVAAVTPWAWESRSNSSS